MIGAPITVQERSQQSLTMPSLTLLRVIRAEFREMPGMRLTREQFGRLWSLTPPERDHVLTQLLRDGFLVETADGRFARRADVGV